MDRHVTSEGTMVGAWVGSLMQDRTAAAGSKRRWFSAALGSSLAVSAMLLWMVPAHALPDAARDAGLQALAASTLAVGQREGAIVLAAKGGRLLKNGTRVRGSSGEKEEKSPPANSPVDDSDAASRSEAPASASTSAPTTAGAVPTSTPTTAGATPTAAASPAPAGSGGRGPVHSSEQLTPVAGLGRNTTDIECVANCPRSTPTVRLGGQRPSDAAALTEGGMECVAGCYGVNMTSTIVDRDELPAARKADGSAGAPSRVTVMRGVTRLKQYTPAN